MKKFNIIFLLFLLMVPFLVFGTATTSAVLENPIEHGSIPEIIDAFVDFMTMVAFAIAPIIFIWAGFKFYFAGGDPNKAKEAISLVKWAVVGLAIIIVANGIIYVIQDILDVT